MKEIINITSLSVTSGATVVQASLDTQDFVLSETIALFTEQGLPVAVVGATKVSGSDYELTLKKPWPYADQAGVKGLLLPTTVDLREVTRQVSKQNDAFTGWFTKMDIWLNEMGTVEVHGPSGATQIETLPQMTYQIQQNADQVQADLALIGDAPMYAQNAKDEADRAAAKALEASNSATAARNSEINSADSEGNSAASASLASSKATAASNSAAAASDSQVAAKDSETASLASEQKSQKWAQEAHNVQVETGLYSAYHWSVESKASADAANTSETNAKKSETNSASSEQAAKQSETASNQHRLEALSWATEDVDVEVTTGKYSAYHYSVKASESEQKAAASEQVATQKASSASSDANLSEQHKQNAASHSLDAADSKNLAKKWAEEAYGVEVLTGEYSAYHWSVDSKNSANAAKNSETAAANSEQIASQKASEASDSESTATLKAGESADSAAAASNSESLAEQHKLKAKEWSEKDVDIEVETGLYSSRHHATKSAGSAAEALQSEQAAGQHKSDASYFMSQAQSHMNKAMQWAEEADGVEVETGKYSSKHWSSVSKGYSEEAKQAAQALTGGMYMGGQWDASTGQVPPTPDVGSVFYKIVNSGTILGIEYAPGDSIIYNPQNSEWFKQDGSDKVDSVNGYVGSVNLTYSDVNALPDTWTPSWSQVKNKPATATRWPTLSEIGAKAEGWTPSWSEVTGKPATATRWPSWSEVTSKPDFVLRSDRMGGTTKKVNTSGRYIDPTSSGFIKINVGSDNVMFSARVVVWSYSGLLDITVGGYTYISGGSWFRTHVSGRADKDYEGVKVRFVTEGGERYILIGEETTNWSHIHVSVQDLVIGYGSTSSNFDITFETSHSGVVDKTHEVLPNRHPTASEIDSGIIPTSVLPSSALIGDTQYSSGAGLSLNGTTFSLQGDVFNSSGTYSSLRARATTAGDVGLGSVRNEDVRKFGLGYKKSLSSADDAGGQKSGFYSAGNHAGSAIGSYPTFITSGGGGNGFQIGVAALQDRLFFRRFRDGSFIGSREIYHTGHKPTPGEIGAAQASHSHSYLPLSGGSLSGDLAISKSNPWLTIDSPGSGGTGTDQGAGISIGESGKKGSAALHLTYTGDGKGWIGMGSVTDSIPSNKVMQFYYTDQLVRFFSTPQVNGKRVYHEGHKPKYSELGVVSSTASQNVGGIKTFNGTRLEIENPVNAWKYIRLKSGNTTKWDLASNENDASGSFQIRVGGGPDTRYLFHTDGTFQTNKIAVDGRVHYKEGNDWISIDARFGSGGTPSDAGILHINGTNGSGGTYGNSGIALYDGGSYHYFWARSSQWTRHTTQYGYIDFGPANTSAAHIYTDRVKFYFNKSLDTKGNVTAYASDERLKENIERIPDALKKLSKLNGVTFDWKKNCEDLGFSPSMRHETGFIAQNVREVIPDAVVPAPFDNEYLTVHKEKIIALLVEALKEEKFERESLEIRLDKIERMIGAA